MKIPDAVERQLRIMPAASLVVSRVARCLAPMLLLCAWFSTIAADVCASDIPPVVPSRLAVTRLSVDAGCAPFYIVSVDGSEEWVTEPGCSEESATQKP